MHGCAEGTGVVELWEHGGTSPLASVSIRVNLATSNKPTNPAIATATPTPPPTPTPVAPTWGTFSRSYRYVELEWTALPDFVSFKLEWRDYYNTVWGTDHFTIDHQARTAVFRGFPSQYVAATGEEKYRTEPIELRLTANTTNGYSVELTRNIVRKTPPIAIGHQSDHTVGFTLRRLPSGDLGRMIRVAAIAATDDWHNRPRISTCTAPCAENQDGHEITLKVVHDEYCSARNKVSGAAERRVACVKPAVGGAWGHIEAELADLTMAFSIDPHEDNRFDPQNPIIQRYRWTSDPTLHRRPIPNTHLQYYDIGETVLHEFGHAFGLAHYNNHLGVMSYESMITAADLARLKDIYENHTKNVGW